MCRTPPRLRVGHPLRFLVVMAMVFRRARACPPHGRVRDGPVGNIRRGDDHRLHVVAVTISRNFVEVTLMPVSRPAFSASPHSYRRGDNSRLRAKRETRQMVLQRDSAATDYGNANGIHGDGRLFSQSAPPPQAGR